MSCSEFLVSSKASLEICLSLSLYRSVSLSLSLCTTLLNIYWSRRIRKITIFILRFALFAHKPCSYLSLILAFLSRHFPITPFFPLLSLPRNLGLPARLKWDNFSRIAMHLFACSRIPKSHVSPPHSHCWRRATASFSGPISTEESHAWVPHLVSL